MESRPAIQTEKETQRSEAAIRNCNRDGITVDPKKNKEVYLRRKRGKDRRTNGSGKRKGKRGRRPKKCVR